MKLKIKYYISGLTLLVLYISVRNWNTASEYLKSSKPILKTTKTFKKISTNEEEITLLLRYTYDTSKYIIYTINSFLSSFPLLSVILVSDVLVPRQTLHGLSNTSSIINIPLNFDLLNLKTDRNVRNHIKTKYLFIAPVGISSLLKEELELFIKILNQSRNTLIAVPVARAKFKCLKLELNLVQWSIEYKSEHGSNCDAIKGDHGIFMYSKDLKGIGEPFLLPFPEAFYIQTTALKMKIKPFKEIQLQKKYENYKKTESLQKEQIYRQLMYKQFKIKKVIRETGITEWYGCTRKTQRCFSNVVNSVPDYLNQGRWTPPCCLRVLRETVHHVFQVLTEWNVTFWLEGGSLLGAMRMKDIIPWDYDVDVGVYLHDVKKCPWLRIINEKVFKKKQHPSVVDNRGFVWEKATPEEGDFYRVQASIHNRLHVDIFPFSSKNGIMMKNTWFTSHPQDKEFPEHYLKPLTTIGFAGIQAPAPNNIKEFLELKFGKGCVENPQYPNPKLFPFPVSAKKRVVNETYIY